MPGFYTVSRLELTINGYDGKLLHKLKLFLYDLIYSTSTFRKEYQQLIDYH